MKKIEYINSICIYLCRDKNELIIIVSQNHEFTNTHTYAFKRIAICNRYWVFLNDQKYFRMDCGDKMINSIYSEKYISIYLSLHEYCKLYAAKNKQFEDIEAADKLQAKLFS